MQTPQTNQTIKQFTPKTNFLIFVKTGLLQYNTTNKGSRPEIQDDPEERRGEKRETTIFNTTNKRLWSMSNDELPSRNFPQGNDIVKNTKPSVSRGGTTTITGSKDSVFNASRGNTGQKEGGQRTTQMYTRVG